MLVGHVEAWTTSDSTAQKTIRGSADGRTSSSLTHPSLITISTIINGKSIITMVDIGATSSLISQSTLDNIAHPPIQSMRTTATLGMVKQKSWSMVQ
jgi:predicted aspartyl protease